MATLQELLAYNALQNKSRVNPLPGDVEDPNADMLQQMSGMASKNISRSIAEAPQPRQPEITQPQDQQTKIMQMLQAEQARRDAMVKPLMDQQKADVERQRDLLKNYLTTTTPKLDLSPLAALVDQSTGSKFAQSYKAPQSAEDFLNQVAKQQQGIGDSQSKLVSEQIKNMDNSISNKLYGAQLAGQGRDSRFKESILKDIGKDVSKFATDNNTKFQETSRSLNVLEDAMRSGNIKQIKATMANAVKAIGGESGATDESAVARSFLPTLESYLQEFSAKFDDNAKYDPATLQPYLEQIANTRQLHIEKFKNMLDTKDQTAKALLAVHGLEDNYPAISNVLSPARENVFKAQKGYTTGAKVPSITVEQYKKLSPAQQNYLKSKGLAP